MKLSSIIKYSIMIALGIVLGAFFCNYQYFQFEKKISVFELFSLVVTIGFGFYISINIGKVFNKENSEKSLLIAEVRESLKIVDRINSVIENRTYSLKNINSEFKLLNENLYLVDQFLSASHCKTLSTKDVRFQLHQLRRIMTNARSIENIVSLDSKKYISVRAWSLSLREQYFLLIFRINGR